MKPCQLPAAIDALVALATAALDDDEDVRVYDGPEPTDEYPPVEVVIGDAGLAAGAEGETSSFQQEWAGIGKQSKTETGQVFCSVTAWSGRADIGSLKAARDRAFGVLALLEEPIRTGGDLGGVALFGGIEAGNYTPVSNDDGTGARVQFTVTYKARI